MRTFTKVSLMGLLAGIAGPSALAHDGDVGIRISGGRLETVLAAGEPPTQVFGTEIERVFAAEWEFNALTSDVRIDEPGLASEAVALDQQSLGFNFRKALRRWNGSDFVATAFTASVGGSDLGLPFITTPASDVLVAGHTITVPQIPLDFHFDWRLDGATAGSGMGIYLVELELTNPGGSLGTSDALWAVYNYGESEEDHEAAIEFAVENYVPTPGGAAVLGLMGLAAVRRRR